jgi:hypothetical protein
MLGAIAALVGVGLMVTRPDAVKADIGSRAPSPTITATVTLPPRHSGGHDHPAPGSPAPEPPPCFSTPSPATAELADRFNSLHEHSPSGFDVVEIRYYSELNSLHRYNAAAGRFERLLRITCSDRNDPQDGRLRWQTAPPPDPAILLPGATRTATEQIDVPVPAISPTGDVAINLGMWLAVEQAGPYVARAAFNDAVWAETTATLATTTFDVGDGTPPIVCDGRGTPIPSDKLDSPEPGPCGHVYADHDAIGSHTLTVTVTWRITWRLSNGQSGQLADIVTTAQHDYAVYEVQTVGVSG